MVGVGRIADGSCLRLPWCAALSTAVRMVSVYAGRPVSETDNQYIIPFQN